ncbi:DUF4249 family protein [Salinimicrobium gaetbulicola]|uniref:DUF4249 family protein n=1 Tax=Salinimicrobium gaetbulicola TaxID=999702 RepID=A0ABW3IAW3_9FLAO
MKRLILLLFLAGFYSCEEVVDVDLEQSEPRLVIEASLLWDKEAGNAQQQVIKLTTTAPYFDTEIPPATGAEVSVSTPDGKDFIFEEISPGIYRSEDMPVFKDGNYELSIFYNDQLYTSTESYYSVSNLEEVLQENDGGFSGDDTEFRLFYTDPAGIENFYLFRFFHDDLALQIYSDEFTDGNKSFAFFSDDDLEPGDEVGFEIQGISEGFYEYLFILRSQAGTAGGPFQTQPTIVRGNIVNQTQPDNFPFGYFRLSETDFITYEVQ